jgi:hypothetical protein
MNPGVSEDVSKVAIGTVDALKSTPVILGVLLFNFAFMAFVAYFEHTNGERWERTVQRTINYCIPTGKAPTE